MTDLERAARAISEDITGEETHWEFFKSTATAAMNALEAKSVVAPDRVAQAFEYFCAQVEGTKIAKPLKLTTARRRALKARMTEHGEAAVAEAIHKLRDSPFCNGENNSGWRADFDFLCQPKSFNRLLEGFYDRKALQRQESELQRLNRMATEMINEERI